MERNFRLTNGITIPAVGFGTWQTPDGNVAIESVKEAIKAGYRHIDTAAIYGNEKSVGKGIKDSGIDRESVFVTSKVWNTQRGYDSTIAAFEKTLKDLELDYLDLYLIHWPASPHQFDDWKKINSETWRAMEYLYNNGKVRSIGVSNFMPHHLSALIQTAKIIPMVNQIEYHPGFMQSECVEFCRENNISVEAWSPLGTGAVLNNDTLKSIAEKHGKSVAQVCLRWVFQNGVLPLVKSVTPSRIVENLDVFGFELSNEEMDAINGLKPCGGQYLDPDKVDF